METRPSSEKQAAGLLAQLGHAVVDAGYPRDLTPAQWAALRFFARANRFSRTVSGFAEFHATTRGTASQTIKRLVDSGHVKRHPSETDGRSIRLDLTPKGRDALAHDPLEDLVDAVGNLAPGIRAELVRTLRRVLSHVARARGTRLFGTCPTCAYLRCDAGSIEDGFPILCDLFQQPLDRAGLDQLCANFEPAN